MIKYTRISSTVGLASQRDGAFRQSFFLNGRKAYRPGMGGYAAVSADRANFGAVFALYQTAGGSPQDDPADKVIAGKMERLRVQMDTPGRHRIDNSINNLADVSAQACGSASTSDEDSWFTGIMIRDRELVSVSQGPAVAYLYRDDALIPLTADELEWPAKDAFGNTIKEYDIYQAGQAGQVRYSNIATLRPNDCILLAPHDILAALGQREVLRLLDEAEDQEEAVMLIMERMSSHASDRPVSLMIMFVESVYEARPDRRGRLPSRAELERSLFSKEAAGSSRLSERRAAQAGDAENPPGQRRFGQDEPAADWDNGFFEAQAPPAASDRTEPEQYRRPAAAGEAQGPQPRPEPDVQDERPKRLDQAEAWLSANRPGLRPDAEREESPELAEPEGVPVPLQTLGEDGSGEEAAYDDAYAEAPETEEQPVQEAPAGKLQLSYLWPFIMVGVLVIVIALLIWQLLMRLNVFGAPELTVDSGLEVVIRSLL